MDLFSDIQQRKAANAKKLASFGVASKVTDTGYTKLIRSGKNVTLYTVGYERRDGDGLISVLLDQGVKAIADIRERPTSRKPDFRAASLRIVQSESDRVPSLANARVHCGAARRITCLGRFSPIC